ncbi:hypothetical protein CSB09_01810 [Candidatus Gracilibacteria bacterium]|nr:MAG: hypothetical protein CSB09_01810 [Candidatus Gracilibacteria bacterium]
MTEREDPESSSQMTGAEGTIKNKRSGNEFRMTGAAGGCIPHQVGDDRDGRNYGNENPPVLSDIPLYKGGIQKSPGSLHSLSPFKKGVPEESLYLYILISKF